MNKQGVFESYHRVFTGSLYKFGRQTYICAAIFMKLADIEQLKIMRHILCYCPRLQHSWQKCLGKLCFKKLVKRVHHANCLVKEHTIIFVLGPKLCTYIFLSFTLLLYYYDFHSNYSVGYFNFFFGRYSQGALMAAEWKCQMFYLLHIFLKGN